MLDQGRGIAQRNLAVRDPQIRRAPNASGNLYDILDLILDKGIVIDAFVRVSLVGIELVTVDARVVIASVDTYLRYAEGAERLQLYNRSQSERIPDFIEHQAKRGAMKDVAEKGEQAVERLTGGGKGEGDEEGGPSKFARGVKNVVGRLVHSVTGSDKDEDEQGKEGEQPKSRQPEQHRGNGHGGKPAKAGARR